MLRGVPLPNLEELIEQNDVNVQKMADLEDEIQQERAKNDLISAELIDVQNESKIQLSDIEFSRVTIIWLIFCYVLCS